MAEKRSAGTAPKRRREFPATRSRGTRHRRRARADRRRRPRRGHDAAPRRAPRRRNHVALPPRRRQGRSDQRRRGARDAGGSRSPTGAADDWEGRVVGYLRALGDAALAHPALGRILAERGLTVGPVFDQLEQAHSILRRAGFSDRDAVRTFYTLVHLRVRVRDLGAATGPPAALGGVRSGVERSIDALDPDAYPTLHALRADLTTAASPDQFEYGLNHLVRVTAPSIGAALAQPVTDAPARSAAPRPGSSFPSSSRRSRRCGRRWRGRE